MEGGSDDQHRKNDTKGFAGLSALVSDVDVTVSTASSNAVATPQAAVSHATLTSSSQKSAPSSESPPIYQQQPNGGVATGKWIAGIVVVIGLIWLVSYSDRRTSSTSPTYTPAAETQSTQSSSPAWQPPAIQQFNRPSEERPPVGNGLSLSMPQLRYCTAENIRLDAAKVVINSYSDTDIDRFNALVADYNSRCGQFKYRRGNLESARSEVEQYRSEIEAEGRARFVRSSAPASSTSRLPDDSLAKPDLTVQAIQRNLNKFGYDAGEEDGFAGERTRAAISSFQRDERMLVDGTPSLELLKRLSENLANTTIGKAAKSTPQLPSQAISPPSSQDASRRSGMPSNSEIDVYGTGWTCKRGFRQANGECLAVQIPPNAELDVYGTGWTCKRGFRQINGACDRVAIPQNAELDVYGTGWTCRRGFKLIASECLSVQIPTNAELDVYGTGWTCKRGFRQINGTCDRVAIPQNAELDVYGTGWTCKRGFKLGNGECSAVQIPANAELDVYGTGWSCKRGYRRTPDGCESI